MQEDLRQYLLTCKVDDLSRIQAVPALCWMRVFRIGRSDMPGAAWQFYKDVEKVFGCNK